MFISVLELFKIGIGPSSSHTLGPMVAAHHFIDRVKTYILQRPDTPLPVDRAFIRCTLKGSLSFTGKGHSSDRAVALGLHGHLPASLAGADSTLIIQKIWQSDHIYIDNNHSVAFIPDQHIIFDKGKALPEHPNGMVFELVDQVVGDHNHILLSETYFSIGGGFINTLAEIHSLQAPLTMKPSSSCQYPFDSAGQMLKMAADNNMSIAQMKWVNELEYYPRAQLEAGIDKIWQSMKICVEKGLQAEGLLPGKLGVKRRAKSIYQRLRNYNDHVDVSHWLCAYAIAVNEENAAGNMVVTAPTNGAAGVIPAILYYLVVHAQGTAKQIREFLLTASAIGGLIKHRSSIAGAEVGCQGEVGSAAAMAAAGLCAVRHGSPQQVENAAEIALEHHLGMTCDPVAGLVQVPCIERNAFGAIKAYTAASLALHGDGDHFMPLDSCIKAMQQTGMEMSHKYKETSLGGLAVSMTEC